MRMILFALIGVLCLHSGMARADSDDAESRSVPTQQVSALVKTSTIRLMQMSNHVTAYGTVTAQPDTLQSLNVPISGQVAALYVVPGQSVVKGTALLEIDPDPSGNLAFAQAQNGVRFASGELTRTRSLYDRQLATRSQVAAAQKALADARQALAAQKRLGNGAKHTRMKAPFDGVVVSVGVARGDRFIAGTKLLQLARNGAQQAVIGIEPAASTQLQAGQKVSLRSVFADGRQAMGRISQVGRQIDPVSRLVNVTVRLDGNPFLNGTNVEARITTAIHRGKAVPREAVLADERGSYIFQIVDGHARRIDVHTGSEDHGWVEVNGALLDAPVVILGNYELDDGMAVRVEP